MSDIPPEAEALARAVHAHLTSKDLGESCFDCEARAIREKKILLCRACPSGEMKEAYKAYSARFPESAP